MMRRCTTGLVRAEGLDGVTQLVNDGAKASYLISEALHVVGEVPAVAIHKVVLELQVPKTTPGAVRPDLDAGHIELLRKQPCAIAAVSASTTTMTRVVGVAGPGGCERQARPRRALAAGNRLHAASSEIGSTRAVTDN
jgi:hypothetical protein